MVQAAVKTSLPPKFSHGAGLWPSVLYVAWRNAHRAYYKFDLPHIGTFGPIDGSHARCGFWASLIEPQFVWT